MNVWRLITHHDQPQRALDHYRRNQFVALGWGAIGDLRQRHAQGPEEFRDAILEIPHYLSRRNWSAGGKCLWAFLNDVAIGDLVILGDGKGRRAAMRVDSDYYWYADADSVVPEYQHRRKAVATHHDPNELWNTAWSGCLKGWNTRMPLLLCARDLRGAV